MTMGSLGSGQCTNGCPGSWKSMYSLSSSESQSMSSGSYCPSSWAIGWTGSWVGSMWTWAAMERLLRLASSGSGTEVTVRWKTSPWWRGRGGGVVGTWSEGGGT